MGRGEVKEAAAAGAIAKASTVLVWEQWAVKREPAREARQEHEARQSVECVLAVS